MVECEVLADDGLFDDDGVFEGRIACRHVDGLGIGVASAAGGLVSGGFEVIKGGGAWLGVAWAESCSW